MEFNPKLASGMLVFYYLLLVLGPHLTASASTNSQQIEIHKQMGKDDLRKVFQVESHDLVPEYHVVHPRLLTKRSADPDFKPIPKGDYRPKDKLVHMKVFGKAMQLNLKPNSEFQQRLRKMKMFMAESGRNGKLKYVEEKMATDEFGHPYHDDSNKVAVLVTHTPQGHIQMDGTIGNDYVIKPMPSSLQMSSAPAPVVDTDDSWRDEDEMFLDQDDQLYASGSNPASVLQPKNTPNRSKPQASLSFEHAPHIVYKKSQTHEQRHSDFAELESSHHTLDDQLRYRLNLTTIDMHQDVIGSHPTHNATNQWGRRRTKRQAPDTVWPEVLLVVDYDSYLLHGANSRDVKRYFISFWNGVDLRYKLLSQPTIRISLAGMIVAKDRDATPYLERNRLRAPNADAVDAAGALTDMGKYLYREDRLPTYDLAVVITKLDMCRRRYEGGRCNRGTAGFAYVGGACVVNKRLEKVNSVAIIEDSGGFSGIIVAAHEVGHLLGCVHDGSPPPSYLGGPGATRCPWEDGFIMSDLRHTERGFRWSSCSTEQFKHFLNGETATCLYNYPHENQLLPRVLPGTMLTLDEQCKRDRGTNACFKDARVCAQLFCFDSASGYCVSYRPAAEGSPCGDGQVCRNGKCVAELENIIPDYTHVTQTISRSPLARSDNAGLNYQPYAPAGAVTGVAPPSARRAKSRFRQRQPLGGHAGGGGAARQAGTTPVYAAERSAIANSQDTGCVDQVDKMAGSMSCFQFLEKFSSRYCNHNYIKRNCCASHAIICGGAGGNEE